MASISDKVAQIRQAVYGKDVRESIASGIEAINEEVENTTSRQNVLETTFEQLIINAGNSNAEIVAARVDAEGTAYPTLGDRLNNIDDIVATLGDRLNNIDDIVDMKPTYLELMKSNPNKFIAHRGGMGLYPENTLIAFEKSCQLGYFGFELDVTQAKDGTWVVMHDDTIDRTTNGTGSVRSFTVEELKTFVIDAGTNIALYPNLRIPTLEEVLQMVLKYNYNTIPCIEIKYSADLDWDSFVNLIRKYGMEDRCIVICFVRDALQQIRNRSNKISIMLNENISSDAIAWLKTMGNGIISTPYNYVTAELVNEAHQNGVAVVAYPVNDFTTKNSMLALGVDLMTTDCLI